MEDSFFRVLGKKSVVLPNKSIYKTENNGFRPQLKGNHDEIVMIALIHLARILS